jgi:PKD repeat protein
MDGDIDVVAGEHNLSNPTSARVHVYENINGGASWTAHAVHTGDEHHDGTVLVDIDNDTDLDVISIGWSHNRVLLYENTSMNGGGPPANRRPVAAMTATPASGFAPLAVAFDASGSSDADGDALTYTWSFGDGGSASGAAASHTYTQTGSFTATVTVGDGALDDTATRTIVVSNEPGPGGLIAHWPLDESSGTTAADVQGGNDGTLGGGPSWQPAGGRVGGGLSFDGNDDRVNVGAMDLSGGSGMTIALWTRVDGFTVQDARFVSKASGVLDDEHFWMLSTINDTALRFRLKIDGTTSTLATDTGQFGVGEWFHFTATYDGSQMRIYKDGIEIASLAISGTITSNAIVPASLGNQPEGCAGAGCSDRPLQGMLDDVRMYNRALTQAEILDLVNPGGNRPPSASFSATPSSGEAPLAVAFDASASSDPDGDALTYSWDFGDGASDSGETAAHTYTQNGDYTVTLTVGDGNLNATATTDIVVSSSNRAPSASFSATPQSGDAPLTVNFDASASSDPDGDALTYAWNFGDGGSGTGVTATHTFSSAGDYTVTLTVSDGSLSATATRDIAVAVPNQPPSAALSATPQVGPAPLAVSFDASGSTDPDGDALTYAWDFGDGGSGSGVTASHTYTQNGNYTVTLTVSDGEFGATASTTVVVSSTPANQPPSAEFTLTPNSGAAPLLVGFNASGSSDPDGDALTYSWDFGDGANASGVTASHTYTQAGNFTVTLTVSDGEFPATATATVAVGDAAPLTLTLGLLQNPYLTHFLDVYLVASEALDGTSVDVTAGEDVISMSLADRSSNVWRGDHELTETSQITFSACAKTDSLSSCPRARPSTIPRGSR